MLLKVRGDDQTANKLNTDHHNLRFRETIESAFVLRRSKVSRPELGMCSRSMYELERKMVGKRKVVETLCKFSLVSDQRDVGQGGVVAGSLVNLE